MSLLTRMLKQICVYWPPASVDSGDANFDDYGQPLVSSPVELACRWEDTIEEFIGPGGTSQLSRAKVFVESDVELGGVLMLGTLDDMTDEENPKENVGAWEIKSFGKNPNFKATEFLRTVYL